MKTIIFLNTTKSGSSADAIKAASEMNLYTILITNNKKNIAQREEFIHVHKMIYLKHMKLKSISLVIRDLQAFDLNIITITSFVDGYVSLAAKLREHFDLFPKNSHAYEVMESKILTRTTFPEYSPKFILGSNPDFDVVSTFNKPMILKPNHSTASRDIVRLSNIDTIDSRLIEDYIIEEFVEGDQYLIEVFVRDFKPYIISKVKQEVIETDTFVITGYEINHAFFVDDDELKLINDIIERLVLSEGNFHIELKRSNNKLYIIELNPRMAGGAMNHLIKVATERDYAKCIIESHLSNKVSLDFSIKNETFCKYLHSERYGVLSKVIGKQKVQKLDDVKEVYIKPRKGNRIHKLSHMGTRLGYVITVGSNRRKVAEEGINLISFLLEGD